jgi:hypothetical protein
MSTIPSGTTSGPFPLSSRDTVEVVVAGESVRDDSSALIDEFDGVVPSELRKSLISTSTGISLVLDIHFGFLKMPSLFAISTKGLET